MAFEKTEAAASKVARSLKKIVTDVKALATGTAPTVKKARRKVTKRAAKKAVRKTAKKAARKVAKKAVRKVAKRAKKKV